MNQQFCTNFRRAFTTYTNEISVADCRTCRVDLFCAYFRRISIVQRRVIIKHASARLLVDVYIVYYIIHITCVISWNESAHMCHDNRTIADLINGARHGNT